MEFHGNSNRGIFNGNREGELIVKVVYSDESGVGAKDELLTVVTAIIINMDEQWHLIEPAFAKITADLPENLLEDGRAVKGRILYGAIRKDIPETSVARDALESVLAITASLKIPIYYGAVERAGFTKYHSRIRTAEYEQRMTDYDVAFEQCLTNVDNTVSTLLPKERLLWIADRSDSQREPSSKSTLETYRLLRLKRRIGRKAKERIVIPSAQQQAICIADTVYFGNSKESVALQLADVCCSTITLHLLSSWYKRKPIAEDFYEIIRPQVITEVMPQYMEMRR